MDVFNQGSDGPSFEDRYFRVKEEREELKRQLCAIEQECLLLRAKNARLEKSAQCERGFVKRRVDFENDKCYENLFNSYESLQRKHRSSAQKHKKALQLITKLKREIKTLQLRCSGSRHVPARRSSSSTRGGGCRRRASRADNGAEPAQAEETRLHRRESPGGPKDDGVIQLLQSRLDYAEQQLQDVLTAQPPPSNDANEANSNPEPGLDGHFNSELQQLQSQRRVDEARIHAQNRKLSRILALHTEYKARYEAAKKEMDFHQAECDSLRGQLSSLQDVDRQNRFLEEKLRVLCRASYTSTETEERKRSEEAGQRQLANLQTTIQAMYSRHIGERSAAFDSSGQLASIVERMNQQEADLREATSSLEAQNEVHESLHQQLEESNDALAISRRKADDLTEELSRCTQRIKQLQSRPSEIQQLDGPPPPPRPRQSADVSYAITVTSVSLSSDILTLHGRTYFVQFTHLQLCDALTSPREADPSGVVSFRHTESISVRSDDGDGAKNASRRLAESSINFSVFSGSQSGEESKLSDDQVVGEACVLFRELLDSDGDEIFLDVVSFEARRVGLLHLKFDVSSLL